MRAGIENSVERFYTALNRLDAYLLLHRLQQVGICAHVFNEHASSIVGEVPPDVAQPQVWLERARDRPLAEAALAALAAERAQTGSVVLPRLQRGESREFRVVLELRW